jgi:hypothetical protein
MNIPLYLGCGLLAGILGGYLGLGGGVVMVPYMTLLAGLGIKEAVPISIAAMVANSIAVSTEYLKKDLVDLSLSMRLAVATVLGYITGSILINYVPSSALKLIFTVSLLYTAYNLAFKKSPGGNNPLEQSRSVRPLTIVITYLAGTIGALIGLGGGVIMVPVLFLLGHSTLAKARGTWSFTYGFASLAALLVFLIHGQLKVELVAPVIVGILIGGKIGGRLGRSAKPTPVKIMFIIVIVYSALKLSWPVVKGLL